MKICSCDPDTQTPAFAVFDDLHLIHWDCLVTRDTHWLHQVEQLIQRHHPELLVIEAQFLPPSRDGLRRFLSIAELCAARGMVQAMFALHGIPSVLAHPFEWQRSLGGSLRGRDALKHLAKLKASDITRVPIANINIADAICIGDWWVKTHRKDLRHGRCG